MIGLEKSRLPAAAVIASLRSTLFIERPRISVPSEGRWEVYGGRARPHTPVLVLWNLERRGHRRDAANIRRAGKLSQTKGRDEGLVTLGRRVTARHALTRKGIDVLVRTDGRVGRVETVRQRLHECYDLVLLLIRQAELTNGHVEVVRDLGHRPAIHLFRLSRRAVSRRDVERKHVPRIVEMDELLQALDVAIVKELLLEEGPRRLGSKTLRRRHRHMTLRLRLLMAVVSRRELRPGRVRIGGGAGAASEEGA